MIKDDNQNSGAVNHDPVPELQSLLGPAVFINWPRGTKGTNKPWGHLRMEDMKPAYLSRLKLGNVGTALGQVSGGLCVIDWDVDEFVKPFLALNPHLAETLQTRGARGRVFWVRFIGGFPQSGKLKTRSGDEVGEFRANGNQSIVWGTHPDTNGDYQFIVKRPVISTFFSSIKWPTKIAMPPSFTDATECRYESSVPSVSSVSSVKCVDDCIRLCIPTGPHRNNALAFKLARSLLTLGVSLEEKLQAHARWFGKVQELGFIRKGQSFDDYRMEFLKAVQEAKVPFGKWRGNPADLAWAVVRDMTLPPEDCGFKDQRIVQFIALCREVERLSGGEPWFISTRHAARLIGVSHSTIAGWYIGLECLKVLEVKGEHTQSTSTRYRFKKSG